MSRQTWMVVERLDNWLADKATDFTRFGIPDHVRKRAEQIQEGDRIVAYVSSGISCFADIRRIQSSKLEKLGFDGGYDDVFPYCIRTESLLALEREQWVPLHGLVNDLALTQGRADWRQILRNPLRLLVEADAERITQAMERAYRASAS